jgi:acyl carrier protein phosphodiesterase
MRRPRGKAAAKLKDEARASLRNLKPSGEKQTLAELREVMTRHVRSRRLASMTFWTPLYNDFCRQFESNGMSVATVYHKEPENVELICEVMWPDRLLTRYPELVLYESVLEYLSF